jgi:hypothetical protein
MGQVKMFKQMKMIAVAAVAVAALAVPASAATYNVTAQGKNVFLDANGKNAWYENVSYALNGSRVSASAGVFRMKLTGANGVAQDFLSFCLEPLEYLRIPRVYADGTSLSKTQVGSLGALVNNALKLVVNSRTAAAFQLAAWEIANEGGKLDLNKGAFVVKSANGNTVGLAQGWLNAISGGKWAANTRVRILTATQTQDLVTDLPPVPVPAAGVLMMGALGGLAALRRRRKV